MKLLKRPLLLYLCSFFCLSLAGTAQRRVERGLLSIYYAQEKVGYEEYQWREESGGYSLEIRGRIDKPSPMIVDRLLLRLDDDFLPREFTFVGTISGVTQEITCEIIEGAVESRTIVAGQSQKNTLQIRRDAFLLPNALFSPFIVLTKKYACSLQEKVSLSAYIVPMEEIPFTLEAMEGQPCTLLMQLGAVRIELDTDDQGNLRELRIPQQQVKILHN